MITLYGIRNCDTVRKARRWLEARGVEYRFHDFRADGTDPERFRAWLAEVGEDRLINRRGSSWRKIPEAERTALDGEGLVRLMVAHPAIVKRPVLDLGDRREVGFSEDAYGRLFP
ncbi:MAG: ArsC family reductase [Gammaproteobacteria bacterium]|nr:ArsC family reductase [Gammaproteobacteria bacterium]